MKTYRDVIRFWFEDHGSDDWFGAKTEFDEELKSEFFETHAQVAAGEAWHWRETADGRVAEIVVLDQFSRQFYRGGAEAFATDRMALALAQELVQQGLDAALDHDRRMFAYMPFMHSESAVVQEEAVRLFTGLGDENALKFELAHRDVIARFGRFPMRNAALGRTSTAEEEAYIADRQGKMF
ncbi:MAG: DUF924 domain-containing protein [Hyphomicrobiaceae bacterium]|nr:DUF924 domain-containing protein [Hyphomicrobiaceae bacterium]